MALYKGHNGDATVSLPRSKSYRLLRLKFARKFDHNQSILVNQLLWGLSRSVANSEQRIIDGLHGINDFLLFSLPDLSQLTQSRTISY